jgi:hypothetical protein
MKQAERQGKHAISPTVKKFSVCLSVGKAATFVVWAA